MNKNPFYEFFKEYIPKLIFILVALLCMNNIIPFISDMKDHLLHNRNGLVFINNTSDICYMGVFLLTLIFTNNFLPQMLNIRGDRQSCIRAFFKMMLIVIIIAVVYGVVVEFCLDYICKLYNVKAEFYTRTSIVEWLGKGMDNILVILVNRFINSMFVMSIAYMCGSMFYRLKTKYNILIFILIPGILFGIILNILSCTQFFQGNFCDAIWNFVNYISNIPLICIILEIIATYLCFSAGNKFLKNAPIAEYAHDLI